MPPQQLLKGPVVKGKHSHAKQPCLVEATPSWYEPRATALEEALVGHAGCCPSRALVFSESSEPRRVCKQKWLRSIKKQTPSFRSKGSLLRRGLQAPRPGGGPPFWSGASPSCGWSDPAAEPVARGLLPAALNHLHLLQVTQNNRGCKRAISHEGRH